MRWLSQKNCLRRFKLSDILSAFFNDTPEVKRPQTAAGPAFVSYLIDIFERSSMLNKKLQGHILMMQRLRYLTSWRVWKYVKRMFQPKQLEQFCDRRLTSMSDNNMPGKVRQVRFAR